MSVSQTSEIDPAGAIKDLLSSHTGWTLEDPNVFLLQERSQSERGPGQGQPAEFYIWSDTTDLSRFSADGDHMDENADVDIWIVTLEETKIGEDNTQYRQDTVQFLSEYLNDNAENTPFYELSPTTVDDRRAETITGTTDHHASVVTANLNHFRPTGVGSL